MINFSKTTWLIIFLIVFVIIAGFFIFQWRQVKGELVKQIEQNENLIKQVNELQKEVKGLKASEEKISEDKSTDWKTYRNEEYGFEMDYPTVDWEFIEESRSGPLLFKLCKLGDGFCIYVRWDYISSGCFDYTWPEIMDKIYDCSGEQIKFMKFKKEIITNFGIKGYKGEGGLPEKIVTVFFPPKVWPPKTIGAHETLSIEYYIDTKYGSEEIKTFDQMAYSFGFIK